MIFGMLNRQKIWHENLTDLSTSPVRFSHFTLGNTKKVIFNSIIHTYFWLFVISSHNSRNLAVDATTPTGRDRAVERHFGDGFVLATDSFSVHNLCCLN